MTTVPFDALIFNSSLTIRATDEGDEAVDTLASSIKAHGVLVPLTVRAAGNHVEIVKGGRRWRAIKRLVADGDLPGDISIPVHYIDAEDDTDARERALAASIERLGRKIQAKRLDAGEARRTRKPKDKSPKPAPVETADTANAA